MTKYIFTCEHGGNKIPMEYADTFKPHHSLLNTHRGYDIGILDIFKSFTKHFDSPNYSSDVSRLLIELNRSPKNKNLFSSITKPLNSETKSQIFNKYYLPYRNEVQTKIENLIEQKHRVVHVSFHSFTPELDGKVRNTDIGLLYDPKSENEKNFCKIWKGRIVKRNQNLIVRFNYPYLGTADGFTSCLRRQLKTSKYCGIELEINQKLLLEKNGTNEITDILVTSFQNLVNKSNEL